VLRDILNYLVMRLLSDQLMYFVNDRDAHSLNVLNLTSKHSVPQTLPRVGSITPYDIEIDANFVYLSNQHPRCVKLTTVTIGMTTEKVFFNEIYEYNIIKLFQHYLKIKFINLTRFVPKIILVSGNYTVSGKKCPLQLLSITTLNRNRL